MKKIWKENAKLILIVFITIVIASGATYAATTMYQSNIVGYDNTTSGLNSNNVQDALDEVYSAATNYTDILARLSALEAKVPDEIYPVGSIYTSIDSTNPSTLFGGTWEAFGTGKTLVGVDISQTEFDTVEETGGEKTHTLTVDEMPSHSHDIESFPQGDESYFHHIGIEFNNTQTTTAANFIFRPDLINANNVNYSLIARATGGDGAHNNLQPYITVYMWKRTA